MLKKSFARGQEVLVGLLALERQEPQERTEALLALSLRQAAQFVALGGRVIDGPCGRGLDAPEPGLELVVGLRALGAKPLVGLLSLGLQGIFVGCHGRHATEHGAYQRLGWRFTAHCAVRTVRRRTTKSRGRRRATTAARTPRSRARP